MKLVLIPNAWRVLKDAWSARLLLVVMAITGLETAVSLFGESIPGPLWLRAGIVFGFSALGLFARVVLQPKLSRTGDDA